MNKFTTSFIALFMMIAAAQTPGYAVGAKEAGASFLLPTTGQAMNDQLGSTKTKVMAGVEVAAITTVAILGGVVGGPVVWAGLGPLLANHAWSAVDAYKGANDKQNNFANQQIQMSQAQKTLEFSRQRRFEREQTGRDDIRMRVAQAAEAAYYN